MSEHNITVTGGNSVRLTTAGKYCDRDILVTALGSGVELPALTNPGASGDLMAGKELIGADGSKVTGSFTLDTEISAQDSLIAQIKQALRGKASGGSGTVNIEGLPEGYVRAGYIQFNCDQVLDTGIIGNQNTKIKCMYTRETENSVYIYGCASSNNTAAITAYLGGNWRFGSKYLTVNPPTSAELINTSIQDKTGVNRFTASGSYSGVTDFETVGSILFGTARNANGTVPSAAFVGKLLLYEIWQGTELALRWVPLVNLDGEYAVWDTVSQTFATSLTGNAFNGGNL